jgi:hypothetical protein
MNDFIINNEFIPRFWDSVGSVLEITIHLSGYGSDQKGSDLIESANVQYLSMISGKNFCGMEVFRLLIR